VHTRRSLVFASNSTGSAILLYLKPSRVLDGQRQLPKLINRAHSKEFALLQTKIFKHWYSNPFLDSLYSGFDVGMNSELGISLVEFPVSSQSLICLLLWFSLENHFLSQSICICPDHIEIGKARSRGAHTPPQKCHPERNREHFEKSSSALLRAEVGFMQRLKDSIETRNNNIQTSHQLWIQSGNLTNPPFLLRSSQITLISWGNLGFHFLDFDNLNLNL